MYIAIYVYIALFVALQIVNIINREMHVYVMLRARSSALHFLDGIVQETLLDCSALLQETLSSYSACAQQLKLHLAHGHSDCPHKRLDV